MLRLRMFEYLTYGVNRFSAVWATAEDGKVRDHLPMIAGLPKDGVLEKVGEPSQDSVTQLGGISDDQTSVRSLDWEQDRVEGYSSRRSRRTKVELWGSVWRALRPHWSKQGRRKETASPCRSRKVRTVCTSGVTIRFKGAMLALKEVISAGPLRLANYKQPKQLAIDGACRAAP